MAKVYIGVRGDSAEVFVEETVDGMVKRKKLLHVGSHSPTGLEWGYAGSGPADLANSILSDALDRRKGVSPRMYQKFKFDIVSGLDRAGFRLSAETVQDWIKSRWSNMEHEAIREDLIAG